MTAADDPSLFGADIQQPLVQFGSREDRTEAVVHALLLLVATVLGAAVFLGVGLGLLESLGVTESATPVAYYSGQTALNFVVFLVVALTYLSWREEPLVALERPSGRDVYLILVGFVVLLAVAQALDLLFGVVGLETADNVAVERGREHPELFLAFLPIQFLFTAPAEELLFRGVVQGLFRRAYGVVPGVLAAGVLFGLLHYSALAGQPGVWATITVVVASGLVLGALYEYSGNLLVPILAHAFWNCFVFGIQYLLAVGAL